MAAERIPEPLNKRDVVEHLNKRGGGVVQFLN